jgi:hypothetical protein
MALSSDQLNQLVEMYAERMVDNMDTKTMEAFIFDTIVENMGVQSEEDIIQHLSGYYDDDELTDMIEDVGGDAKEVLNF